MADIIKDLTRVVVRTPLGKYKTDIEEYWGIQGLKNTQSKVGAVLKKVTSMHRIPYGLVLPFCTVESGGESIRASDGLSYGIMQCNAATLDGVIKFALSSGMKIGKFKYIYYACPLAFKKKPNTTIPPLNWPEIPLVSHVQYGWIEDPKIVRKNQEQDNQLAKDLLVYSNPFEILPKHLQNASYNPLNKYNQLLLKDTTFAAHVGCIFLYQLMTKSLVIEKGVEYVRVDWMINGYNGGYYKKTNPWITPSQGKLSPDVWLNQPSIPMVTFNYVKRLCGIGGYLDLIKQGKFKLS